MKKLTIPEHISLKKEFMPGITGQEGKRMMTAFIPAIVFTVAYWVIDSRPGPRLAVLVGICIYAAICYAVFSCPDGGQSIYTFVSRWVRFMRTQQSFKYKQKPEVLRFVDEEKQ